MRKQFCCEASRGHYIDYYMRQQNGGGEMPSFMGSRFQRGHGLGSMIASLFRRVIPFLRANAKTIGSTVLRTGMHIADDVLQGKKFVESAKQHVPEGIKDARQKINWQTGEGFGRRGSRRVTRNTSSKRKRSSSKKKKQRSKAKRSRCDIFK